MSLMQKVGHMIAAARRGFALPLARPGTGTFLINLGLNNLDIAPIKTKNDQLDNYVGWVYAAVSTIAEDLRANPRALWLKTGKRREDWKQIPTSKLPPLFRRPNNKPNQNTWGKFIELRNIHKDITGEAWWHLLTTMPGGRPQGIELIQPDQIEEPVFNADYTDILFWWVNPGSGSLGGRQRIDARDLILDFYPNPRDPLRGASPIEAFALAHHMDIYVRAYGLKLIRDGSAISQYVKTDLDLNEDEVVAIESRLNRKFKTPGRFAVLSKGAELKHASLPLRDLDMLRILRPSRDQILGIYKVPPSKLGLTEGAGDTNQKVADKSYQENALLPRLTIFDETMNEAVLPRVFGDEAEMLAYESENPVEVDREWEFEKAERKLNAGAIKVNQFLQEIGDDAIGDDGEVYFIPSAVRIVRSLAAASETGAPEETLPAVPAPSEEEPEPPDQIEESARRIALAAARMRGLIEGPKIRHGEKPDQRNEDEIRRLRRAFAIESFLRNQEREERSLKSDARSVFSKEQREIKQALRENENALRAVADDWKSVSVSAVNDESVYWYSEEPWRRDWLDDAARTLVDDWNRVMTGAIRRSTRVGWNLLKQEIAGALDFKVFEQKAAEFARRVAAQKVQGIQTLSIKRVRDVIRAGVEEGLSVNEIARRLDRLYDQFKGVRAETIARTETAMSINYGRFSAANESSRRLGMDIRRSWIATEDERTRDTHWSADADRNSANREIDMETSYTVGGIQLWHPGDSDGPPQEVINCLVGDTRVEAIGVLAATRRWYEGPLVTIRTSLGHELSGTPNHSVSTARGPIVLNALQEGDQIVHALRVEEMRLSDPDVIHAPTTFTEIFSALSESWIKSRVPGLNMDFHGDGTDGDVDIIFSNGELKDRFEAAFLQPRREQRFPGPLFDSCELIPQRALMESLFGIMLSAANLLRGRRQSFTFRGRSLRHADGHRGAASTRIYSGFKQNASYGGSGDLQFYAQRLLGRSGQIAFGDVIEVKRIPHFTGHVHNLQTRNGIYIGNSIITWNCRCVETYEDIGLRPPQ